MHSEFLQHLSKLSGSRFDLPWHPRVSELLTRCTSHRASPQVSRYTSEFISATSLILSCKDVFNVKHRNNYLTRYIYISTPCSLHNLSFSISFCSHFRKKKEKTKHNNSKLTEISFYVWLMIDKPQIYKWEKLQGAVTHMPGVVERWLLMCYSCGICGETTSLN